MTEKMSIVKNTKEKLKEDTPGADSMAGSSPETEQAAAANATPASASANSTANDGQEAPQPKRKGGRKPVSFCSSLSLSLSLFTKFNLTSD